MLEFGLGRCPSSGEDLAAMASSARFLGLTLTLSGLGPLAPAFAAQAPQELPTLPLAGEALDNDAFLVHSASVTELLVRGDRLLVENGGGPPDAARAIGAFELWRQALATSELGDAVAWWASEDEAVSGVPTAVESVEAAVEARLRALPQELLGLWAGRFEARWESVGDPLAAASEARLSPGTRGATRHELREADRALALGHALSMRTHARRARVHALLADDAELVSAADRRIAGASALDPTSSGKPAASAPTDAPSPPGPLRLERQLALGPAQVPPSLIRASGRSASDRSSGGLFGGLCELPDGRLAIQGPIGLLIVDPATGRGTAFDPTKLAAEALGSPSNATGTLVDPPWLLRPAVSGDGLVLVEGRLQPYDALGNVLLKLHTPPPLKNSEEGLEQLPELAWALRGDRWAPPGAADGVLHPLLEGLAEAEFQPGPVVAGERVVVQVRRNPGSVEAFLLGLDATTGEPLWRRLVASGQDRTADAGRFASGVRAAAAPLFEADDRVLVTSGLGTISLHDALDGRLIWSVRHRRRATADPSFSGLQAVSIEAPGGPGEDSSSIWAAAPPDSDRILLLPNHTLARPAATPTAPYALPLVLVPGASALLGSVRFPEPRPAGSPWLLLTRREGARHGLLAVNPHTGAQAPALRLPSGERWFRGPGGAAHATQKAVYLFDPGAELLLTQSLPWLAARPKSARAPSVTRIGDRLIVLGPDQLCIFGPATDE